MWWSRKVSGFPGLEGFEPEVHAAELGRHGVDVHAVEAAADDVAQGVLVKERRRLALARRVRADPGEVPGKSMCRADEEVTGADGGVADLEVEDRPLGLLARLAPERCLHHRVERGVEQTLNQYVGGVEGAGRLPGIAGELGEGEVRAVAAHLRGERGVSASRLS